MPRETTRKIKRDPAGVHVTTKRDSTGTVQMSQAANGSTTISNTANAAFTTVTGVDPNLVAQTSATAQIAAGQIGTTETPINLTILRDGSTLASTTHSATGSLTLSTSATLTTPANDPSWTFQADLGGGSAAVTHTVSREDRWV